MRWILRSFSTQTTVGFCGSRAAAAGQNLGKSLCSWGVAGTEHPPHPQEQLLGAFHLLWGAAGIWQQRRQSWGRFVIIFSLSFSLRKGALSGFCFRSFLTFTPCLGLVVRSLQILSFFIWAPWMLWGRKGIIVLLKARQGSNNQSNAKLFCVEQEYQPAVAALDKGSVWFLTRCFQNFLFSCVRETDLLWWGGWLFIKVLQKKEKHWSSSQLLNTPEIFSFSSVTISIF